VRCLLVWLGWAGAGGGGGGGGSQYKLPLTRSPDGGPIIIAHAFVSLGIITVCRLYKLAFSHQAHVTLQLSQSFQFSVKIFSWFTHVGGVPNNIFTRVLNLLSVP